MTDLDRAAQLKTLTETPARLKAALKGLPKKLLLWTPGPGKWSMLEIVAHMRDMEKAAYIDRYRRILSEDDPTLPDHDGDVIALREDNLRLLRSLPASQWRKVGLHPKRGETTIERVVEIMIGHDQGHFNQITAAVVT